MSEPTNKESGKCYKDIYRIIIRDKVIKKQHQHFSGKRKKKKSAKFARIW